MTAPNPAKTLDDSVTALPGIGPARQAALKRLGIRTVGELLNHLPRDYRDRSVITQIGQLANEDPGFQDYATIRAFVKQSPGVAIRHKVTLVTARVSDSTGDIQLVWYNQPYMKNNLKPGEYFFSGEVSRFKGALSMESPEFEAVTGKELLSSARIVPIYPLTEGLSQKVMRRFLRDALDLYADAIAEGERDPLPPGVMLENGLIPRKQALFGIHYPESPEAFRAARKTLVFTELFT